MARFKFHLYGMLAILVVAMILITVGGTFTNSAEEKILIGEKTYTEHEPIRINSDSEFDSMASAEGWPGDGSPSNPYVISGYYINCHWKGFGIYIGNVSYNFIVRDCYFVHEVTLSLWKYGAIHIYNSENGSLLNNTFSYCEMGIYIENSPGIIVSSNNFRDISRKAVEVYYSDNCSIEKNYFGGTCIAYRYIGIYSYRCSNITIYGNIFEKYAEEAINLRYSDYSRIYNNRIQNSSHFGLYLMNTKYCKIYGNTMINCSISISGDIETFTSQDISTNNTVNGKPVRYYKNINGNNLSVPQNTGEIILGNVSWIKISNIDSVGNYPFIFGYEVSNITISKCKFRNGTLFYSLINLWKSNYCKIASNNFINISGGVISLSGNRNRIDSNYFYGESMGTTVGYGSSENIVINNSFGNCTLYIQYAEKTKIYGNQFFSGGIYLVGSESTYTSQYIPSNNTVNGKPIRYFKNLNANNLTAPTDAGELILGDVSWMTVENLILENTSYGIVLGFCDNITVVDCKFMNIYGEALLSYYCDDLVIERNVIYNDLTVTPDDYYTHMGIYIGYSHHCIIRDNSINNTYSAIWIVGGETNYIINNSVFNSVRGVDIGSSSYVRLYNNKMINSGIMLDGYSIDALTSHTIPTNNTVNGKPVRYYKNMNAQNLSISQDAGQLLLVNVSWALVDNITLENSSVGLLMVFCHHITVSNCSMSRNTLYGLYLMQSSNNRIVYNLFNKNGDYGVYISWDSDYNILHHNSFYYNNGSGDSYQCRYIQARDYGKYNWWNNSQYGNYWHDWANNNNTNDQNGDGIVDYPYIYGHLWDQHPLKNPTVVSEIAYSQLLLFFGIIMIACLLSAERYKH